jgi:hypothetical protein
MKEIGNIHLCWRPAKGSSRIAVGIIKHSITRGVRFNYLKEGVAEAQKFGFKSYEGFPDLDKEYTENVIEIFGQRIIKSERSDVKDFYDFWGVNQAFKDNDIYMLAYTQGLLPTDNFEFLADFNPEKGLSFVSEIAGLTEAKLDAETISEGDELTYELEPDNLHDSNAVKLYKNGMHVGYIKLIHSRVFYKVSRTFKIKAHAIEANGILKRVFIKISLH